MVISLVDDFESEGSKSKILSMTEMEEKGEWLKKHWERVLHLFPSAM